MELYYHYILVDNMNNLHLITRTPPKINKYVEKRNI